MTTRINVSRTQIQSAIWLVVMLLVSVMVSGRSIDASRCPDQKSAVAISTVSAGTASAQAAAQTATATSRLDADLATTGVDLEVRIWNVRIGFPWLKSLPLTPGRRIVVSLWDTNPER